MLKQMKTPSQRILQVSLKALKQVSLRLRGIVMIRRENQRIQSISWVKGERKLVKRTRKIKYVIMRTTNCFKEKLGISDRCFFDW